jgi:hypothetical protein
MKIRQRKRIVNRWRPVFLRFGASVFYGGQWQRATRSWWSREKHGGVLRFGVEKEVSFDLAAIMRTAKPLSLKGL